MTTSAYFLDTSQCYVQLNLLATQQKKSQRIYNYYQNAFLSPKYFFFQIS